MSAIADITTTGAGITITERAGVGTAAIGDGVITTGYGSTDITGPVKPR